jgi:hypothetical protein
MFVEENNRIFVVENNQVVASFVKEAYYGSCPHPDCEEHGKTKYDIKKNENCKACGTSMKVEFPKGKKKEDSETESKKESAMQNVTADLDPVGEEDEDIDNDGDHDSTDSYLEHRRKAIKDDLESKPSSTSSDDDDEDKKSTDSAHESSVKEGMSEGKVECDRCGQLADCTKQGGEWMCDECAAQTRHAKSSDEEEQDWEEDLESAKEETSSEKKGLGKGKRVSHREKEGTIVSIVPGLYGDAYGVKFDDGKVAEFLAEQLIPVESAAPIFLSAVEAINSDYIDYESIPANTYDELEDKTKVARSINLRAKSLILDSKLSMNDRVQLDKIIISTAADISDFKEGQMHLQEIEAEAYLARAPKYELNDEFIGWGSVARTKTDEDISWVNDIDADLGQVDDATLISLASDAIKSLSREQLEDEGFMEDVHYYNTLRLPNEAAPRFAKFLREAVAMKLEEPVQVIAKEASVESFDDVDDAALYM